MQMTTKTVTQRPLPRRDMLKCAVAAVAVSRGALPFQPADRRVDCHLHCFAGTASDQFPYHANAPYRPEAAATPEHLLNCMDGAGVDYAIVVHPEPYQDDHRYLEHCLSTGRGRLKGTCLFFADDPTAIKRMRRLAERAPIVAARIHAYAPDRMPPFGTPELSRFWKAAGDCGLAVQLHFEPRYAAGFEPLIRDYPHVPVIIDHLGRPFQGTPEEHEVVVRWARFPNTHMKLSSIPTRLNYPHRDPLPVIRRLCNEYGPDRMLYGGGFSATTTGDSYRGAFEHALTFLADWSPADRAKVLGENAVKLFQFGAV